MTSQVETKIRLRLVRQFEDISQTLLELSEKSFQKGSPWTLEQFEQIINQKHVFVLLAEINNEICGFLCGGMNPFEAEVYNIATAKEHQNKGIATQLLKEMKRMMAVNGVCDLFLEVRKSNLRAMSVYKKAGFEACGFRKSYYHHPEEDAVILKHEIII